ncbi:MAG: glutamine--fructose-6-phosphate transaminase (isomerizing), partial [Candidatus Binataceae bacterium]
MCGIVGYIGPKKVVPVIIEGLRKLEYRGYDSAGIAVVNSAGKLEIRRAPGKLRNLEEVIQKSPIEGTYGIGHTRWATHGRPTEENAHPHRDCSGEIVVVHNGIIENYLELKEKLQRDGHKFVTETDTEVVAHLVEHNSQGAVPLEEAVRKSLKELRGIYSLVFLSSRDPHKIVAARNGPPSVIGLGNGEFFVASDIPALLEHTRQIFFLADGDIAILTQRGVRVMDHDSRPVDRPAHHVAWDPIMAEKGGYKHFMQKEIFEQPRAVRDTLLGRISQDSGKIFLDEMQISEHQFRDFQQVRIVACGTSWHAGLAGKFMIERLARLQVEVDYGSEFRYRDPIMDSRTLTVCISQSGETADTLAAQREAKLKGSPTLAICNVMGSMITREAAGTIITHAGPEIGVASTKAFTAQLTALLLLASYLGQARGKLLAASAVKLMQEFTRIPHK